MHFKGGIERGTRRRIDGVAVHPHSFGRMGLLVLAAIVAASCNGSRDSFGDEASPTDPRFRCGHDDCDGDGYAAPADCNDGDRLVNPEAYDFPDDGVDNDCDGHADNPVETCETIPTTVPGTPADFARAADVCPQRSITNAHAPADPLLKAEWGSVRGYGGPRIWLSETKMQQVNIVSSFGKNDPRRGRTMFGLATGPWGTPTPRESPPLDDPQFHIDDACAAIPLVGKDCASLTQGAPAGGVNVQDWAELKLWLKAPSNAKGVAFDFSFLSSEFNQFWNASLNDAFFVLVTSATHKGENVAKDASGFAIGVNSGFFQVCAKAPGPPGLSGDKSAALLNCVGTDGDPAKGAIGSLRGTYYDGAASIPNDGTAYSTDGTKKYVYGGGTGWLTARFGVEPGESFTMRIILHDTFDGLKDSAVLFDGFRWEPASNEGVERPR